MYGESIGHVMIADSSLVLNCAGKWLGVLAEFTRVEAPGLSTLTSPFE
jgi:hypothetical protein